MNFPLRLQKLNSAGMNSAGLFAAALLAWLALAGPARAQLRAVTRFELSGKVDVDDRDPAARGHLVLVAEHVKNKQWSEALDAYQQLLENFGEKLLRTSPADAPVGRYLSVRDYCQAQLAQLPAEALALYRQRIDPQARQWYETALAARDIVKMRQVCDDAFASSWSDEALLALGDWAVERGELDAARAAYRRILPRGQPGSLATADEPGLSCPAPDVPLADVYARLVWVSILQGPPDRAEIELQTALCGQAPGFAERFPESTGRIGGKSGKYAILLADVLKESREWSAPPHAADWKTFAGDPARNGRAPRAQAIAGWAWSAPLEEVRVTNALVDAQFNLRRIGENPREYTSYHPVVSGEVVFVGQRKRSADGEKHVDEILAFDLRNGKPAYGTDAVIFRHEEQAVALPPSLGVPRQTLTIQGRRLLARIGPPVTSALFDGQPATPKSYLVCLDLKAEGKLLWDLAAESKEWSFDGTPLADDESVYTVLRRAAPRPEVHVACYDLETKRERWKRRICASEVPLPEGAVEITHHLLTLHQGKLYLNTNQGAVVALDARSGRIHWLTLYPRARGLDLSEPQGFSYRDLTPCVFHQGLLFAAPADTPAVLAFDAETGRLLWSVELPNVIQLLGATDRKLLCTGDRLYWLDFDPAVPERGGRLFHSVGHEQVRGFGRGLLAGKHVYWPGRHEIRIFECETGVPTGLLRLPGEHGPWGGSGHGGNLILARGRLLVAEPTRLVCYQQYNHVQKEEMQRLLQTEPPTAARWFQLARCEEALEEWTAAAADYQRALRAAQPDEIFEGRPLRPLLQDKIWHVLQAGATAAAERGETSGAVELLRQAARYAPRPLAAFQSLQAAAELAAKAGDYASAVSFWHEVWQSAELSELSVEDENFRPVPAARLARRALVRIAALAPAAFATVHAAAERDWTKLRATEATAHVDPAAWQTWLRTYPLSPRRAEVYFALWDRWQRTGQLARGQVLLREAHDPEFWREGSAERFRALIFASATQEALGRRAAARAEWSALAALTDTPKLDALDLPAWAAERAAPAQTVVGWAHKQLAQHPLPSPAQPVARVQAAWQLAGSALLAPEGTPPCSDEALVLRASTSEKPGEILGTAPAALETSGAHGISNELDQPWDALASRTGQPRWTAAFPERIVWAGYGPSALLVLGPRDLRALACDTGERLWRLRLADPPAGADGPFAPENPTSASVLRRAQDPLSALEPPPEEPLAQAAFGPGDLLLVRQGTRRVLGIDTQRGLVRWVHDLAQGKLLPHVTSFGDHVLIQAGEPGRALVLRATDGTLLGSLNLPANGPWPRAPVPFDDRCVIVVPSATQVVALEISPEKNELRIRWERTFPGRSPRNEPAPLRHGSALVLFYAGSGMMRLAPEDGRDLWPDPVALDSFAPWSDPAGQIAVDERAVSCVSGGILRAFALADGQPFWAEDLYLGPRDSTWRVARQGPVLWAWPASDEVFRADVSAADPGAVVDVFRIHAADGQPLQRLRLPLPERSERRAGELRLHGFEVLLRSGQGGWGFSPARPE